MSESGSEEATGVGAGSALGRGITVSLAILAAYFASFGPVCYLGEHGMLPLFAADALETVYWPIGWLHGHTPLKKPIEAYVDCWMRL